MFDGFNQKTISVLDSLKFNNSKSYYNNIKEEYAENITKPLKLLSEELIGVDRKSTRLNSSHPTTSRMPSSA